MIGGWLRGQKVALLRSRSFYFKKACKTSVNSTFSTFYRLARVPCVFFLEAGTKSSSHHPIILQSSSLHYRPTPRDLGASARCGGFCSVRGGVLCSRASSVFASVDCMDVQAQTDAPLNTGTVQKSVSQTGSKLAREAPRHACWHLPRRRPKAAAGGGARQRAWEPFWASFEPI